MNTENLKVGDKVKYKMSYNRELKDWDALIIDTNPLTLSIKFPDGYRMTTEPDPSQYKHITS